LRRCERTGADSERRSAAEVLRVPRRRGADMARDDPAAGDALDRRGAHADREAPVGPDGGRGGRRGVPSGRRLPRDDALWFRSALPAAPARDEGAGAQCERRPTRACSEREQRRPDSARPAPEAASGSLWPCPLRPGPGGSHRHGAAAPPRSAYDPAVPDVVELFTDLAALPSPPGEEREVADRVTLYLRELGLEVDEDDAGPRVGSTMGNLLCRLEPTDGGGLPIFFCAHLDTVPPEGPVEPVLE